MNKPIREQPVNDLREKYLKKAPYPISPLCDLELFTPEEIEILKKYGHWFYALSYRQVPLVTEKQKKFVKAQAKGFERKGIYERLWYRYTDATKVPF